MTVQEAKNILNSSTPKGNNAMCIFLQEAVEIAIECMEQVEQYRALGTVEELKEAREKQKAKKPKHKIKRPNSLYGVCSVCDRQLVTDKYCPRCGQKVDWEEGGTSE